ncbi:MAG: MFS transporter [Pseudomonadota bacterium]|nr:MFS transporter [Pseudomonadota bacterium]
MSLPGDPGGEDNLHFAGLALTEFWERLALSGVKSMLTLLLINQVLPASPSVLGMSWLQGLLSPITSSDGPGVALASYIYGVANALVYLAVPLGGFVGDLLIGRRAAVLAGGASMAGGLLLMTSLYGFMPGLLLFASGAGLLKSNLSAQFGGLFGEEAKRRRAYSWYLVFLNAGVICGPLAMGAVALAFGWRHALVLAAVSVVAGMSTYLLLIKASAGTALLRQATRRQEGRRASEPRAVTRLWLVLLAGYLCFAAYGQVANIVLVWAETNVDLDFGFGAVPVGWLLALDGLFTILLIFIVQAISGLLGRRGVVIGPHVQIILGCLACAAGYLVLILADGAGGSPVSLTWLLAYLLLVDLAVVLVWPSGLSLATGLAPNGRAGGWGGLFYLYGFFASLWVGFAGGYFQSLEMADFWLIHAGVALLGAALALVAALLARPLSPGRQAMTTSA